MSDENAQVPKFNLLEPEPQLDLPAAEPQLDLPAAAPVEALPAGEVEMALEAPAVAPSINMEAAPELTVAPAVEITTSIESAPVVSPAPAMESSSGFAVKFDAMPAATEPVLVDSLTPTAESAPAMEVVPAMEAQPSIEATPASASLGDMAMATVSVMPTTPVVAEPEHKRSYGKLAFAILAGLIAGGAFAAYNLYYPQFSNTAQHSAADESTLSQTDLSQAVTGAFCSQGQTNDALTQKCVCDAENGYFSTQEVTADSSSQQTINCTTCDIISKQIEDLAGKTDAASVQVRTELETAAKAQGCNIFAAFDNDIKSAYETKTWDKYLTASFAKYDEYETNVTPSDNLKWKIIFAKDLYKKLSSETTPNPYLETVKNIIKDLQAKIQVYLTDTDAICSSLNENYGPQGTQTETMVTGLGFIQKRVKRDATSTTADSVTVSDQPMTIDLSTVDYNMLFGMDFYTKNCVKEPIGATTMQTTMEETMQSTEEVTPATTQENTTEQFLSEDDLAAQLSQEEAQMMSQQ